MEKSNLYQVDEFGVKNYNFAVLGFSALLLISLVTLSIGYWTYLAETSVSHSPVKTYSDSVWLMLMSATTIGFGDVYPVTLTGRFCVYIMFILGVGLLGTLGALFANKIFGFADTNVKNRELRKQNADIYAKLIELEEKLDNLTKKQ